MPCTHEILMNILKKAQNPQLLIWELALVEFFLPKFLSVSVPLSEREIIPSICLITEVSNRTLINSSNYSDL